MLELLHGKISVQLPLGSPPDSIYTPANWPIGEVPEI
jgi:hypothetical protein